MKQLFHNNLNKKFIKNKVCILCTCYERDYLEVNLLVNYLNHIDYDNFEFLLMIDDEYKKHYDEIYEFFSESNIKKQIFYSGENLGNYTHYNTLWNYCDGEFIFITEPNSILNPNLIKECINIFNRKINIDCIQYKYCSINVDNFNNYNSIKTIFDKNQGGWGDAMFAMRKNIVDDIGYFENARYGADSDFMKRLIKYKNIHSLNMLGQICIGHCCSKKFLFERENYWNSEILPVEKYCYLENNKLKLNFNYVENLAPVCSYSKEMINNKKKILIIGHNWDFIDNIINELDKSKYHIEKHFFLESFSSIKNTDNNLYISLLNNCAKKSVFLKNEQKSEILTYYENLCNKYDIVFCEWFEILVPIISLIKNKKFRLIVRLHSYEYFYEQIDNNTFRQEFQNKSLYMSLTKFSNIDKLIVVNDWFKEKISKNFKINNIVTIPNYYKIYDNRNLHINKRKKNIGIVGINPLIIKGLYDLLLIFKNLVKQDNEYKLYIKGDLIRKKEIPNYINIQIGEEYYQNSIELYNEMIKKYPNNIVLCKHTNDDGEDMETFYNNIGYLLTASIQESFHCVVMEAGSAGCIPILYENKKFHNLDVARTPQIFRFISFDEIDNIINYIINNKRFEQLSMSALEYYNSMNTAIKDFENLFDNYNNDNINVTFLIPKYNENNLVKYENYILDNIGSNLNKNIEIIIVSNKITKLKLIELKKCWDNGYSYRDSSVKLNYNLKITLINLKKDININFKILIGIKNSYKNSRIINILFDSEIVRIPHCNLEKYNKFIQSRINDNSYLNLINSNDFKNIELEIPKVIAVIPVYGRESLLKYTVRRLYEKNYIYKVIIVGENDSERNVIENEGGIWLQYSNVWLGDKWNIGFKFSKKYKPDAMLFVGSSDWVSQDWIFSSYKYIKEGYGYVGKNDYHMIDISNNEINSNHWLGYPWEDRKYETIGIGRLISREFLEKIEYKPFDKNSNIGMDKTMYQKCLSNGLKVKIINNDTDHVTFLSLSCDLWVNKHVFKYHKHGANKYDIKDDAHYMEYKPLYDNTNLHTKKQYKNLLDEFSELNEFYEDYKNIKKQKILK